MLLSGYDKEENVICMIDQKNSLNWLNVTCQGNRLLFSPLFFLCWNFFSLHGNGENKRAEERNESERSKLLIQSDLVITLLTLYLQFKV